MIPRFAGNASCRQAWSRAGPEKCKWDMLPAQPQLMDGDCNGVPLDPARPPYVTTRSRTAETTHRFHDATDRFGRTACARYTRLDAVRFSPVPVLPYSKGSKKIAEP